MFFFHSIEGLDRIIEHVGLPIEDDGVTEEPLGLEVRSGFEIFLDVAARPLSWPVVKSFVMVRERAASSRCELGVREAAMQISSMCSRFFSDLRRSRATHLFCFKVRGVVEIGSGWRSNAVVVAEAREHQHCCKVQGVRLGFKIQRRKWREL